MKYFKTLYSIYIMDATNFKKNSSKKMKCEKIFSD